MNKHKVLLFTVAAWRSDKIVLMVSCLLWHHVSFCSIHYIYNFYVKKIMALSFISCKLSNVGIRYHQRDLFACR